MESFRIIALMMSGCSERVIHKLRTKTPSIVHMVQPQLFLILDVGED